jgi:LL-diaminopimelate aminotransferase
MKIADRVENLPPYVFARLGNQIRELTAQGKDIVRLDIGSPDLPPPDFIVEAMHQSALDPGHHGYAGFYGTPELRQAMAGYYARRFGVQLDPEKQVVPLIGSKEGIFNIAFAFVNPGDRVLIPDPGYPTYTLGTLLAGGVPYRVALRAENGFLPDLGAIPADVARSAKILWLNYPNNPTGAIASIQFLEQAVEFARTYDILLCHDNPYCDVTFGDYVAPSLLQVEGAGDVAVEFNSLSKTYNMAGWRVGMAVGNGTATGALARIKTNIDSGIFRAIQDAAVLALNGDQTWLQDRNEIYRERRDIVLAGLRKAGLEAECPVASLYVWARIATGYNSANFAERLLLDAGISVTPGTAFGPSGEGYIRISLGMSTERVREAMARLEQFSRRGGDPSSAT